MYNQEELPKDIEKQLNNFSTKLKDISTLSSALKEEAISKQGRHLKKIKILMEAYQYSIQSGDFETTIKTHKSQYKEFEQQLAKLEKSLDICRNDGTGNELFKNKKSNKNIDYNSRDALVVRGN